MQSRGTFKNIQALIDLNPGFLEMDIFVNILFINTHSGDKIIRWPDNILFPVYHGKLCC